MRLAVIAIAAACPVAAAAFAGRARIATHTSAALAWVRPAGTLGPQVAVHSAMIAECVERLDDYDQALSIIGTGMMGRRQRQAGLRSLPTGEAAG